jgi:hypothetical protein
MWYNVAATMENEPAGSLRDNIARRMTAADIST